VITWGNYRQRTGDDGWSHRRREPRSPDRRQVARGREGPLSVDERAELVGLIALRGNVLGCIADSERAAGMAYELVGQAPTDARSFLARARTSGVFHRFELALGDLDTAAALGGDGAELDAERAAIYQALGRYDEALAIRRGAADSHADFNSLVASRRGLQRARGDGRGRALVHGGDTLLPREPSPFPLAMLEFQRGKLWMEHDDLRRARAWCEAAVRRLPAYVPAHGHLAELDAALGETAAGHRPPSAAGGRI